MKETIHDDASKLGELLVINFQCLQADSTYYSFILDRSIRLYVFR